MIIYEQPLNEIIRIMLKLEYLLAMCAHHLEREDPWDSHTVLIGLCDILNLLDRPDLRSKLTKEIQRYINVLTRLTTVTDVNKHKVGSLLTQLNGVGKYLLEGNGRLAQSLREDELLNNIRHHLMSPGGTCSFDIPVYHYWQQQSTDIRMGMITNWYQQLEGIKILNATLLSFIRGSGQFQSLIARQGFYQMTIESGLACQLIQIRLSSTVQAYPEISAGKHRLCVYFMNIDFSRRAQQINDDLSFEMALCVI